MKKMLLIIVSLIALMFIVAGCQEVSPEVKETNLAKEKAGIEKPTKSIAGQAVNNMAACLNTGCPQESWPGDKWCDAQCNNAACNFDDGDCQKDGSSCSENHQCESFQCSNGICGDIVVKLTSSCDEILILNAGDSALVLGGHNVQYVKQDYAGGAHFIDVDGETLFEPSTVSAGTYVLSSGTEVKIMDNLQQDYAGGEHQVKLCFNNEPQVDCAGEVVSLNAGDSTLVLGVHNVQYVKQDYAGGAHFIGVDGETLFEPSTVSAGTYVLSSGTEVKIMANLQQDYAGGEHQVRLCFEN